MAKCLTCHTYGAHIYMKIQMDNNQTEEIDAFLRGYGETFYKTTGDNNGRRSAIIKAFNELY